MSAPLGKTLLPAHYGILFYSKEAKGTKFYEIRAPHKKCRERDAYLKDCGGKKDQMHPFGYLVSDVWTDIHRLRRDEHPCQLPIHLLERLILMTTDADDIVLDPFLGTGRRLLPPSVSSDATSVSNLTHSMWRLRRKAKSALSANGHKQLSLLDPNC